MSSSPTMGSTTQTNLLRAAESTCLIQQAQTRNVKVSIKHRTPCCHEMEENLAASFLQCINGLRGNNSAQALALQLAGHMLIEVALRSKIGLTARAFLVCQRNIYSAVSFVWCLPCSLLSTSSLTFWLPPKCRYMDASGSSAHSCRPVKMFRDSAQ